MRTCVITKARNEGPYLLEWVAHHVLRGFDSIIIVTNDLDDGSGELLKALEDAGHIQWIDATDISIGDGTIGGRAFSLAWQTDSLNDCDWVIGLDLDEFLVLHSHDSVSEFLSEFPEADMVVVNWRNFGAGGLLTRNLTELVTESFTKAVPERLTSGNELKTFGKVRSMLGLADHVGRFKKGPKLAYHSSGEKIQELDDGSDALTRIYREKAGGINYSVAQINHYTTKSVSEYILRQSRGRSGSRAIGDSSRYDLNYFLRRNRRLEPEESLLPLAPALRFRMNEWKLKYGLEDTEKRIAEWHSARIREVLKDLDRLRIYEEALQRGVGR